jgi:apolipoprotein N-acyltransferase
VWNPKRRATQKRFSTSHPGAGDYKFVRHGFRALSREYSAGGANLMLVPAWDFNVDGWLHSRMAILRGLENGFALARAARNGLLTLSDNRSRILAETATAPGRFVSVTAKVNVPRAETFYARVGDWFARLCVAGFVVLLGVSLSSALGLKLKAFRLS